MSEETVSQEVLAERLLRAIESSFMGYLRSRYGVLTPGEYLEQEMIHGYQGLQKEPDCGI